MLEDRVDVAPVRRHAGDRLAGEEDLALGRLLEPGDHPQGRRLAAARRPEEASRTRRAGSARFIRSTAVTSPKRFVTSRISTSRRGRVGPRPRAGSRVTRRMGAGAGGVVGVDGDGQRGPRACGIRALSDSPVASLQGRCMVRASLRQRQRAKRANLARTGAVVPTGFATDCTYTSGPCSPAHRSEPVVTDGPRSSAPASARSARRAGSPCATWRLGPA